ILEATAVLIDGHTGEVLSTHKLPDRMQYGVGRFGSPLLLYSQMMDQALPDWFAAIAATSTSMQGRWAWRLPIRLDARRGSGDHCSTPRMPFVYIVQCADGTLYTGYAVDLDDRIARHNAGSGAKYTSGRRPVSLVYSEFFASMSEAMRREYEIKRWTRARKEAMIAGLEGR